MSGNIVTMPEKRGGWLLLTKDEVVQSAHSEAAKAFV